MTPMRYRLRTLLWLAILGPPILAQVIFIALNWSNIWLGFSGMVFGY